MKDVEFCVPCGILYVEIPVWKTEKKGQWIMGAYANFKEIIDTMESQGYDWKQEIGDINEAQKREMSRLSFRCQTM